jgi:hypothetical protein
VNPGKNFAPETVQEGEPVENWEDTLKLLRRQGWEYTCAKFIDLEAQEEFYWVSINRGDLNLTSLWPTLEEASFNVNQFLVTATS